MKSILTKFLIAAAVCVLLAPIGGCPLPGGAGGGGGGGGDETGLTVVKTTIPVRHDASLKIGDDVIVFGTGAVTGVSYVVPSHSPAAATAIPGNYHSDGFAVAGKKVLVFMDDFQLHVFDTGNGSTAAIPADQVYLSSVPDREGRDIYSPVIADGLLAITLNRADQVTDGRVLKLVDVSSATPVVTPLKNPPVAVGQVAVSATDQVVVTFGGDKFFVYDLTKPSADPQTIDLSIQSGIFGPFVYHNGYILYVAKDAVQNMRLLNVASGATVPLSKNPGNRDRAFALRGGKFAYFLNRNAYDSYSIVYRSAIGTLPSISAVEGGTPGADPTASALPWEGYGDDVAITPSGDRIFISGEEDIDATTEFLQVSTSGGAFLPFADGSGHLAASDVTASDKLVAFKIGSGTDTKLAYIVLP